eukprot:6199156-Pleurochrysis_carterae.AAC.1
MVTLRGNVYLNIFKLSSDCSVIATRSFQRGINPLLVACTRAVASVSAFARPNWRASAHPQPPEGFPYGPLANTCACVLS